MAKEIHRRTVINEKRYSFSWTIENFSKIPVAEGNTIKSAIFSLPGFKTTWQMAMLHTQEVTGEYTVRIFIKTLGNEDEFLSAWYNFYAKTPENVDIIPESMPNGFQHIYKSGASANRKNIEKNVVNDELFIMCGVTMLIYRNVDNSLPFFMTNAPFSAVDDIKKLYLDQILCDFTLKLDGDEIRVHKAILAARSPVFAGMMQHDTTETRNNAVVIEDIPPAVMKAMVWYMYSGEVDLNLPFHSILDLYSAANRYLLTSLEKKCSYILDNRLDHGNAQSVYDRATLQRDERLKETVERFLREDTENVLRIRYENEG